MSPFSMHIALFFADGRAYLVGMLCVAVGAALLAGKRGPIRSFAGMFLTGGVLLVICSSTPAPVWLYAVWALVLASCLVLERKSWQARPRVQWSGRAVLALVCLLAAGMEANRRRVPELHLEQPAPLVVIGDSISAGMTHGEITWPKVLAARHAVEVVDLSRAGETVESALTQAKKLSAGPAVVLLEIGGNDLLGDTTAADYERGLERLLREVEGPGRTLVMFELPLPPLKHQFGWIQRRLAACHGVVLIPKRVFADVLGSPDGTADGLHLSERGHERMADWVWRATGRGIQAKRPMD